MGLQVEITRLPERVPFSQSLLCSYLSILSYVGYSAQQLLVEEMELDQID